VIVTHNIQQAGRVAGFTAFLTTEPEGGRRRPRRPTRRARDDREDLLPPGRRADRRLRQRPVRLSQSRAVSSSCAARRTTSTLMSAPSDAHRPAAPRLLSRWPGAPDSRGATTPVSCCQPRLASPEHGRQGRRQRIELAYLKWLHRHGWRRDAGH
jgi:hypothetical protein